MKDDQMMARIKEAEHTQSVAILKQKISRLELKVSIFFLGHRKYIIFGLFFKTLFTLFQNHEMVAEGELRSNVEDSDRVKELQDEVAYLKAEVN